MKQAKQVCRPFLLRPVKLETEVFFPQLKPGTTRNYASMALRAQQVTGLYLTVNWTSQRLNSTALLADPGSKRLHKRRRTTFFILQIQLNSGTSSSNPFTPRFLTRLTMVFWQGSPKRKADCFCFSKCSGSSSYRDQKVRHHNGSQLGVLASRQPQNQIEGGAASL